jgi:hypothetical protein
MNSPAYSDISDLDSFDMRDDDSFDYDVCIADITSVVPFIEVHHQRKPKVMKAKKSKRPVKPKKPVKTVVRIKEGFARLIPKGEEVSRDQFCKEKWYSAMYDDGVISANNGCVLVNELAEFIVFDKATFRMFKLTLKETKRKDIFLRFNCHMYYVSKVFAITPFSQPIRHSELIILAKNAKIPIKTRGMGKSKTL